MPPASKDSISHLSMVLFLLLMLALQFSDPRNAATSLTLGSFAYLGLPYHVSGVCKFSFSDNTKHISIKGSKQH